MSAGRSTTVESQIDAPTWAPSNCEMDRGSESHAKTKHGRTIARSNRSKTRGVDERANDEHASDERPNDERPSDERSSDERVRDERADDEHVTHEHAPRSRTADWRVVDRALRTIAFRRAALDAEEARWLREAESLQIWRRLGMVNAIDYMERVLGYKPRTAEERLRVARALGTLREVEQALETGELSFSAVRELTRVATPQTEAAWIREARGKNVHEIEQLVAGHRPGDTPDAPPDPTARMHVVRLELTAEAYALFRQGSAVLREEHCRHLDDSDLISAAFARVLDAPGSAELTGRAKHQIAITLCAGCRQGWQDGGGATLPIDAAAVARAECDAQYIGSLDADAPARAWQDVSPATARFVWRRDHGRCRIPGCRSSRALEIHHIVHRCDGGSHDPSNLILACGSCHRSHHEGRLAIAGTADHLEVRRLADEDRLPIVIDGAFADAQPTASSSCGVANDAGAPPSEHLNHGECAVLAPTSNGIDDDAPTPLTLHTIDGEPLPRSARAIDEVAAPPIASYIDGDPVTDSSAREIDEIAVPPSASYPVTDSSARYVDNDAALSARHVDRGAATSNARHFVEDAAPSIAVDLFDRSRPSSSSPDVDPARSTSPGPAMPRWRPAAGPPASSANSVRSAHVGAFEAATARAQAKDALTRMGYKPHVAGEAIESAIEALGDLPLEQLVFQALRRCPGPRR